MNNYLEWLPYNKHYDRAEEFERTKARYEAAYNNNSDVEGFLRNAARISGATVRS